MSDFYRDGYIEGFRDGNDIGYQKSRIDVIDELIKNYCITDNLGCEYVVIDKVTLKKLKENQNDNIPNDYHNSSCGNAECDTDTQAECFV